MIMYLLTNNCAMLARWHDDSCKWVYRWKWRHQDWAHSNAVQSTPSSDQSSVLHQANESSTGTACKPVCTCNKFSNGTLWMVNIIQHKHITVSAMEMQTLWCYLHQSLCSNSHLWKWAQLNRNLNTMCSMTSIRTWLLFRYSDLLSQNYRPQK